MDWSRLHRPDSLDLVYDHVHDPGHIIHTLKVLPVTKSMIQATSSWQSRYCLWPSPWPRPNHPRTLGLVCDQTMFQATSSWQSRYCLWPSMIQATSSWQSRYCLWPSPLPRPHHPHTLDLVCDQVDDPGHIIITLKVLSVTKSIIQATSSWV